MTFRPAAAGDLSTTLAVSSDDPDEGSLSVAVVGRGLAQTALAPVIALSPAAIAFDSVRLGNVSRQTLTISNTGSDSLRISRIAVAGADSAHFSASPAAFVVSPGKNQAVTVTFAPGSVGRKSASLTIAHNAAGSPSAVPLSGTGVAAAAPAITLSATSFTFDSVQVGNIGRKTLTVSNTGGDSLRVTRIAVAGPDSAHFSAAPTAFVVAPGKTQAVTLTFAPGSAGKKEASLSIAHNAAPIPVPPVLIGIGFTPAPTGPLTPKAGDGTALLDLNTAAGDQAVRTLGGVKPGQKVEAQVLLGKEYASATGFQVILKFDSTKMSNTTVSGRKDGTAFTSAIDLPAQVKADSVIYGASILGGTTTASGSLAVLTFQASPSFSGETAILLHSVVIRLSGAGAATLSPGASVVLSATSSGPPTPDFDGDGEVGFGDFFLFAGAFGQKASGVNAKYDLDGDGDIGFGDFFVFAAAFGKKV